MGIKSFWLRFILGLLWLSGCCRCFLGFLSAAGQTDVDTLKAATITGAVMASFTVEKFGTQNLEMVTEHDIRERTKAFSNMIRVDGL